MPVAGPSSAPLVAQTSGLAAHLVTPKKSATDPIKKFDFTPATGTQVEYAYQVADQREVTRKAMYEANRQRAEGMCVVTDDIDEWFEKCLPASSYSDERSPEAWKDTSIALFEKVPTTHNEAQFVSTFPYPDCAGVDRLKYFSLSP